MSKKISEAQLTENTVRNMSEYVGKDCNVYCEGNLHTLYVDGDVASIFRGSDKKFNDFLMNSAYPLLCRGFDLGYGVKR